VPLYRVCYIIARGQFASPSAAEGIAAMTALNRDKAAASCHQSHLRLQPPWRQWDPRCQHGYPKQSTKAFKVKSQVTSGHSSYLMKCKQRIYLHDRKVVPKQNKCRDVNDVLRAVPEMWEELSRSRGRKPDNVAQDHVPMVLSQMSSQTVMLSTYHHGRWKPPDSVGSVLL
jgi:hypothetical protein